VLSPYFLRSLATGVNRLSHGLRKELPFFLFLIRFKTAEVFSPLSPFPIAVSDLTGVFPKRSPRRSPSRPFPTEQAQRFLLVSPPLFPHRDQAAPSIANGWIFFLLPRCGTTLPSPAPLSMVVPNAGFRSHGKLSPFFCCERY